MDLGMVEKLAAIGLLLSTYALMRIVVAEDNRAAAMDVCMALAAAALVAFLIWFVFDGPTPAYAPEYGGDPCDIPVQMKD